MQYKELKNINYTVYYQVFNKEFDNVCFLVHGLGDSITSYIELIPEISKKNYKIVVYNLLGCGSNNHIQASFEDNLDVLHQLIITEGKEHNYFIGHSMGGLILLLTINNYAISYQKILTIEPSITNADYNFFKFIQEPPTGIGYDEFVKGGRVNKGYLEQYHKNLRIANIFTMKDCIRTVFMNFKNYQQQILHSDLKFNYIYGELSTEPEERKKLNQYPNIYVTSFQNANHWVHIDATYQFFKFLDKFLDK